jgi:hypothetical protein
MENHMKRSVVVFLLSLSMVAAVRAQQTSSVEISLSSGYVLPASPMTFANYWKMEAGGGLTAGIAVSPSVMVLASVEYYRYKINTDGINKKFDTQYMRTIWIFRDVSLQPSAPVSSIMTAALCARMESPLATKIFSPYLLAGAGAMFSSFGEISLPTTSVLSLDGTTVAIQAQQRIVGGTETTAFIQTGLGVDARLNDLLKVFIEARFAFGMSKSIGTAYVPLTAGVRLQL